MEARSKRDKQLETLNRVFRLELLRDLILDYVIHGERKDKAISNIRACRLVCKNWLRSISRILLQCQEPLFRFSFSSSEKSIGDFMDSFVSGPTRLYDRVPPLAIRADDTGNLLKEQRHSLSNCLVHYASGLVELGLPVGDVGVSFKLDADFMLPNLKKLGVHFYNHTDRNYDSAIVFIQSVLDACTQLKSFSMEYNTHNNHYFRSTFTFPSSITELRFTDLLVDDDDLEALGKSFVPTLKKLELTLALVPFKEGLITSILEKVRKTLKGVDIHILSERLELPDSQPTTFQLPLMEKLESLEIDTEYLQLEQNPSSLEQFVPALRHMTLVDHTVSAFRKWTESSCFHSVTSLKTSLCARRPDFFGWNVQIQINFDLDTMRHIKRAFPNLRKLDITVCEDSAWVPLFIMKEMTKLQHLRIATYTTRMIRRVVRRKRLEFWEALLLGISLESAAALQKCPTLWENNLEHESTVCIRNLTDLQYLHIDCTFGPPEETFVLSSGVFTHAFFKMPNLTHLRLDNRFRVPEEIVEAWRIQRRSIEVGYNYF